MMNKPPFYLVNLDDLCLVLLRFITKLAQDKILPDLLSIDLPFGPEVGMEGVCCQINPLLGYSKVASPYLCGGR